MRTTRRGVTLVELVVAMVLVLITMAIGALTARRSLGTLLHTSTNEARGSAISDALRTIARHAANADAGAGDIRVASDTVLELVHMIGVSSVCRSRADTLVLTQPDDSTPWRSTLPRTVTTDDAVRVWQEESQHWVTRTVRAVGTASGACGDSAATWPGSAMQRLVLSDTAGDIRPGAIVRILQHERWSQVRGGDGSWSLSLATWDAAAGRFSVPQPLVAPLSAPDAPDGAGFAVDATDDIGIPVTDTALTRTRSIVTRLRSQRHTRYGIISDSVRINVSAR